MPLPPPPRRPSALDTLRWWLAYWIARPVIRREIRQSFEDGYALGMTHGMQVEAEDQIRREDERGPEATPEPHDACIAPLEPLSFNHPEMSPLPTPQDMVEVFGVPARLIPRAPEKGDPHDNRADLGDEWGIRNSDEARPL